MNQPSHLPPQHQSTQPGHESQMDPQPQSQGEAHRGSGKLQGLVALISGGDSGIGRAVSIAMAREGAQIALLYLNEHEDAQETQRRVEAEGSQAICIAGDIGSEDFCRHALDATLQRFGHLDILINNAAEQHPQASLEQISAAQLERTFRTNVFGMFFLTKAALPHLPPGSVILNTASVTAYKGSPQLLDYSATKGAIVAFTRSLALALADRPIRVNAVAPGPIWTPLIPSTFPESKVGQFGSDVPLKRVGQPEEVAGCYVFLASKESSYITGQVLHPNGGTVVNG